MNKKAVLITGASSGIGLELAREFAQNGYDLVLAARNIERLRELAEELTSSFKVSVYPLEIDLFLKDSPRRLYDEVYKLSLDIKILVNNAGFGKVGLFHEIDLEQDLNMIQLNIAALTELTKLFSRDMVKLGGGRILNVASTGSFHPGPYTAVYYATKAYVLSFSEAISKELKPFNISVTALCPGATRTNFCRVAGKKDLGWAMDPSYVARAGFRGLMKNRAVVVPGIPNRLFTLLPRGIAGRLVGRTQKRLSGN